MVYQEVSLSAAGEIQGGRPHPVYTISVDEKPGVQALGLTAPDLPPVPGQAPTVSRTTSMCGMARYRFWPVSICIRGTCWPTWKTGIEAVNSLPCCAPSMRITHWRPLFAWSWITTRRISPKKPWPTSPPGPGLRVCAYAQAWLLAQPDRVCLLKNGPHLPATDSRGLGRGTERTHP